MKKLFCVLLVMSMLFPLCCANAIDESEYYGTWMQDHYNEETGYYSFEVLRLTPDHRAYFVSQSFSSGEVGLGRQFPTKWEAKKYDGIRVWFWEDSASDMYMLDDGRLGLKLIGNAYSPYFRVTDPTKTDLETPAPTDTPDLAQQLDGMRVPQGEYVVGDLIPAGRYLVTLSNDDLAVIWVKKPGQIGSDYYSLVYSTGETEAYIVLEEGGTFRVQHSTVILSEPKGF